MQSMIFDARALVRYKRVESVQEDGDAVATYVKAGSYLVSIRQTRNSVVHTELGDVHQVGYTAWVNDTHDFAEGDRLGDSTAQLYEVASVLDNITGQSMELTVL